LQARLFALALLLSTPALAGCGFTPLYAAPGVAPGLSAIETVAPEGRTGFLLRQAWTTPSPGTRQRRPFGV